MALPLSNNAEGGTSGTTVSTANSGGASGDAWGTPVIGTGMTLTFDNAHAAHGTLAYKVALTSTATAITYLPWPSTQVGTVTEIWGRLYIWSANLTPPAASLRLVRFLNAGTAVAGFNVASGTGAIECRSAADALIGTASASSAITASTWMRLEFHYLFNTATGETARVNVYTGDSATINTSATCSAINQGAACNEVRFGANTAAFSSTSGNAFWLDDINVNATGLPGPATAAAAVRPAPVLVRQAVQRTLTRCQKLTRRESGLFVPAAWSKRLVVA